MGGRSPHAGGWGIRVSPYLRPREGVGGQSPPRRTLLSPCGCGPEARAPGSRPTGGSGRAQPSQEQPVFIPSGCGAAAFANVNIRPRRGGGETRFPHAPAPQGHGETGFPPYLRPREGVGGRSPPRNNRMFIAAWCGAAAWTATVNIGSRRGGWGNRVSPRPRPAGAWGNRVSPCPHPREGVGGLHPPKNKRMFIAALCGAAAWTAEVTIGR